MFRTIRPLALSRRLTVRQSPQSDALRSADAIGSLCLRKPGWSIFCVAHIAVLNLRNLLGMLWRHSFQGGVLWCGQTISAVVALPLSDCVFHLKFFADVLVSQPFFCASPLGFLLGSAFQTPWMCAFCPIWGFRMRMRMWLWALLWHCKCVSLGHCLLTSVSQWHLSVGQMPSTRVLYALLHL